jgi:hypothetical protein
MKIFWKVADCSNKRRIFAGYLQPNSCRLFTTKIRKEREV